MNDRMKLETKENELLEYRKYLYTRKSRHNQGTEGYRSFTAEIRENTQKLQRIRDEQKRNSTLLRQQGMLDPETFY